MKVTTPHLMWYCFISWCDRTIMKSMCILNGLYLFMYNFYCIILQGNVLKSNRRLNCSVYVLHFKLVLIKKLIYRQYIPCSILQNELWFCVFMQTVLPAHLKQPLMFLSNITSKYLVSRVELKYVFSTYN